MPKLMLAMCASLGMSCLYANEEIDRLTQQWITIEQQVSSLDNLWKTREPILEQQRLLLEREVILREESLQKKSDSDDRLTLERKSLLEKQTALEKNQNIIAAVLQENLLHLRKIAQRLPPPLQETWLGSIAFAKPPLSNSELLQEQAALLQGLSEFNERVGLHSAPILLKDGGEILTDQIYLGASLGYYLSLDGAHYGIGTATEETWTWMHNPDFLDPRKIQSLLESARSSSEAALVSVPVIISNPSRNEF